MSRTADLDVVVAPGGTLTAPGDGSAEVVCQPQDFHPGERVLLTTGSGAPVRETVLPACDQELVSAPETRVAGGGPSFSLTLPEVVWAAGDAWVLHVGAWSWPLTAATLSEHGWSITVTAQEGIGPGRLG